MPLIGIVASRWTQVEVTTQRIMSSLLHVQGRVALGLSTHIGDRTALDIIMSVARQYKFTPGGIEAIEAFCSNHNIARSNRNLLVHGIHGKSERGIKPVRRFVQKLAARGNVKIIYYEISTAEMVEIANEIGALAAYGQMLNDYLNTSGGTVPPVLPPQFPRLRDRSCTLNQLDVHDVLRPRSFATGWTEPNAPESGPH